MKINDILNMINKPKIYEKGTHFMWTNEYISRQLLQIHLNPDVDLASRNRATIEKTIEWILDLKANEEKLEILDLGCGPGLYSERLAKKGHQMTGIDISKNSIDYAKTSAKKQNLKIDYRVGSYLDLELEEQKFDMILLIYTDFGVLNPSERKILLDKIHRALKPNGIFVFDVLSDSELEQKISPKNWELCSDNGFWDAKPYLELSNSYLYEEQKVILYQNAIITEDEDVRIYRFWTGVFNDEKLSNLLQENGFADYSFHDDVLAGDGLWDGKNVIFTVASKN